MSPKILETNLCALYHRNKSWNNIHKFFTPPPLTLSSWWKHVGPLVLVLPACWWPAVAWQRPRASLGRPLSGPHTTEGSGWSEEQKWWSDWTHAFQPAYTMLFKWELTRTCDQLTTPSSLLRMGSFNHKNCFFLWTSEGHHKWKFLSGHPYDGASFIMLRSKCSIITL